MASVYSPQGVHLPVSQSCDVIDEESVPHWDSAGELQEGQGAARM